MIFLSSFVPAFGSIIALPAAAVRTSTLKFVLLSLAGAVGSTTVYVLLGYSFSPILLEYNNFLSNLAIEYILYLFALVCAAYIGYYALKTLKVMRAKHVFIEKASESTR